MKVSYSAHNYDSTFDVSLEDMTLTQTKKVMDLANRMVLNEPDPAPVVPGRLSCYVENHEPYVNLNDLTAEVQRNLIVAARLVFHNPYCKDNKINVIKFVRSLVRLSLKDAKDLVEYAIEGDFYKGDKSWMKGPYPYLNSTMSSFSSI